MSTREERLAAFAELTAAMQRAAEELGAKLAKLGEAFAAAAAQWPPERVLKSVIQEHNRRMAEINHREEKP